MLFYQCVVRKDTSHVKKKALNMCHQAQKDFVSIFVGNTHNKKGSLVYVPHTRNIIYSYYAVFDERFYSELAYTSQPYSEAITMLLEMWLRLCQTKKTLSPTWRWDEKESNKYWKQKEK